MWTRRPVAESRLADAELVFAGYGIVAPEYGWNDYAGLDVRGKVAVVLVNDPGYATRDPSLFTGTTMTYYGRWTYKFEEAVRQGAAGLLVVHETGPAGYPWDVVRNGAANPQFDLRIADPAAERLAIEGWVTQDGAQRLLALAGLDYAALKQAAAVRGFRGRPLGITASAGVRNEVRFGTSYNVVGMVPGSERPDEFFVYTAHWDHLGTAVDGDGDRIFNGAADNATGTAALIEIGRAFASTRPRPKRSVMFVAVTLEESGLLGSQYFAENPPVPVAQHVRRAQHGQPGADRSGSRRRGDRSRRIRARRVPAARRREAGPPADTRADAREGSLLPLRPLQPRQAGRPDAVPQGRHRHGRGRRRLRPGLARRLRREPLPQAVGSV